MKRGLLSLLVLVVLLAGSFNVSAQEPHDVSIGAIQYEDINNEFEPAIAPWDWQMLGADYHLRVKEDFTSGQIMEFEVDGSTVQLQPMGLEWSNDLSQIQQVSMPQDVTPVVTNPDQEGTIVWNDAYGSNIDFEWKSTPIILNKTLTILSLSDLPVPQQYILDGGSPFLRLNLVFDPSADLDIYVDDNMWDKASKVQTFNNIEFRKDGQMLWAFMPLMYWDSEGNEGQSVATLEKSGNSLYISIRVPYSWLQTASYPVYVDADVTIEAAADTSLDSKALRGGVFWTSPTVGYIIYPNVTFDLVYRKTADGGANWGAAQVVVAAASCNARTYDCYADWQTAGDAGTKIHIAFMSSDTNEIRYVYLDTSDDSVGGDDVIETCQGTGTFRVVTARSVYMISITKTRGGNLAVAFKYQDDAPATFDSFYTSPDAATWTSEASPYEASDDYCLLFPGNEADNQDVWGVYWDASADEISLKTYDDSGNAWSAGTSISLNMAEALSYIQMDGAIRLSDGHLLLVAWNLWDNIFADLMTWDINGEGSITAKTNVLTNSQESFLVSMLINQNNDDWYVAYAKGTAVQATVQVFYQLSQNGGANWDGQAAMQADAAADERWISCGVIKTTWGGKFQPVWFNDDLNDIFTNTDNGISIAAAGVVAPTVVTNAATSVEETTATASGNITATGSENCTDRGFQWDIDTGVPYADNWTEAGNFGVSNFTHGLTALTEGELYYYRAGANNTAGWGYGAEVTFLTKPDEPNTLVAVGVYQLVSLSWNKGTGSDNTTITAKLGSYPANRADGAVIYDSTGTSANHTGLGDAAHWYYRAWSWCTEGGKSQYSDAYDEANATTYGAPTVTNDGGATNVTDTEARLRGEVTDTGGENPVVHIYWGLTDKADNATAWDNDENLGALGLGVFYDDISGLSANTTYFYRCSANNTAGIDWANSTDNFTTLTTPPPPPPSTTGMPGVPPLQPASERMSLILAGCVLILFSELGFWRRNCLLFMLAGGASLMVGFQWYNVYTNNIGLAIGISLMVYALVCMGFAYRCIFRRERVREEE